MTMDEIHSKLKKQLEEENHDYELYSDMAKCTEMNGDDDLAFGLWLIAADEKSHKDFIEDYLAGMHGNADELMHGHYR